MEGGNSASLLLGAVGAAAAYYLYARNSEISEPCEPASIGRSLEEVDAIVDRISKNTRKWRNLPAADKLRYLQDMQTVLRVNADEVVAKSAELRGWKGTIAEGGASLLGLGIAATFLGGLIEVYTDLAKKGVAPGPISRRKVDDVEVAQVAPRDLWQKVTNPMVVELWGEAGKHLSQSGGPEGGDGMIEAVLNPGNFEGPVDVLYKLFVEGNVVVAKSHPVNALCVDFLSSRLFAALVRDGYVGLLSGGPEVGQRLLHNPRVQSWMMTGGCGTFDAIVWGGAKRKGEANAQPLLEKRCHAELGAASPYIIVPGTWTDAEVDAQASVLVGSKMFNAGHVCASPQLIVMDRQWPLSKKFLDTLEKKFNEIPRISTYYPGTEDRLNALKTNCPSTVVLGASQVHFVRDVDAEGGGGEYIARNEVFGPGLGVKFLDGNNNALSFLEKAIDYANTKSFGSLSCTVVIQPGTQDLLGDQFDRSLIKLDWGTVGVNIWAGFGAGSPVSVWGAPPGRHNVRDIQSGEGFQGNCLWIQNVRKAVLRGKWCDPAFIAATTPSTKMSAVSRSFAGVLTNQSYTSLLRLAWAIGTGK